MSWQMANTAGVVQILLIVACTLSGAGQAVRTEGPQPAALTTDAIVQKLVAANARRARALGGYRQTRLYSLNYQGLLGGRTAAITVSASFTAPDKKEFTVVARSGSTFLINHVLQRLLDSEKDAWQNEKKMELTPDNYDFSFVQMERSLQGDSYILEVKPRTNSKYLYKGRIWVDAHDFAVTRIAAQPARNPSFWVSRTAIDTHYAKFGEFWLPLHNESITHVRFGGDAVLSIDYTDYRINDATQAQSARPSQATEQPPLITDDPH